MSYRLKMPVKTTIKPYCYLKPLDSNGQSIYLHNGETTRLSHDGRIVSPIEDPESIHIRVKPDVIAKTLSTIYVSNYKGCWINGCMALCWYKYMLNHGHIIRLQSNCYEYEVNFFPPPQKKVADLLLLKIPKSLTEIPKKVMDELVSEAKMEYFEEKLKAKESIKLENEEVGSGEHKTEKLALEKTKPTKKQTKKKKCVKGKKQPRKPSKIEKLKPQVKHVHFKTRPKLPQTPSAEEQTLKSIDYLSTTAVQTTDDAYKIDRSVSLSRKVIFSAEAAHTTKIHKKHVEKFVKFIPETSSERNVVIVEPEEDSDDEIAQTKSGIFEMVLDLYEQIREEERGYARDKNFAMYLMDKILRKVYKLKMSDVKFVQDLLDDVVEDVVTMKHKDLAFAKRVVDEVVDQVFVESRRTIEKGWLEWLLSNIFKKIRDPEGKLQEGRLLEIVESSGSSDDDDDDDSSESGRDEEQQTPVVKTVYEID